MTSSGKGSMPKPNAQTLEWYVCEDDREWQDIQHDSVAPSAEIESQRWTPGKLRSWGLYAGCTIAILTMVGGWLWQRAQAGIAEVANEVKVEIVAELWSDSEPHSLAETAETNLLHGAELPNNPSEVITQVEIRTLGNEWAVVEVVIQPATGRQSYRQTRLYQDTGHGWARSGVVATRWGRTKQLESDYFVFYYRELDEGAVIEAAPKLDALYSELTGGLYQGLAYGEKLVVIIDPEYELGSESSADIQAGTVVASPSATLAPAKLATSDLLLQSIVLKLYNRLITDVPGMNSLPNSWLRIHDGLRLWFLWEHELPLAVWRKPLVEWLLTTPKAAQPIGHNVPAFAKELCLHHRLWMLSPVDIAVPILCWERYAGDEKVTVWPSRKTIAELSPGAIIYSSVVSTDNMHTWQSVADWRESYAIILATVFEYVATSYGSEQIPLLLAAIPEHEDSDTLIPAVFSVSLAEFEEGWRAFLIERYEISR